MANLAFRSRATPHHYFPPLFDHNLVRHISSAIMKTQALVVLEPGDPFALQDIELDEPRPDECLLRIVATGICHTDLKSAAGGTLVKCPAVLGHEGGEVLVSIG